MIEIFAIISCDVSSEYLDLNPTSKPMISSVPFDSEARSPPRQQTVASFGIGTLAG
jgi:hypothetical protein